MKNGTGRYAFHGRLSKTCGVSHSRSTTTNATIDPPIQPPTDHAASTATDSAMPQTIAAPHMRPWAGSTRVGSASR